MPSSSCREANSYGVLYSYQIYDSLETSGSLCFGALLDDGLLDTTSLGQSDLWGGARSNYKDVGGTSGKSVSLGVLHRDNVEGVVVVFDVHDLTHSASVTTLGDGNHGTKFELEDIGHFSGGNIDLDGVVDLDIGVRVPNGASIVSDGDRDLLGSHGDVVDTAELVLSFVLLDFVHDKSPFGVEHDAEQITGLLQLDDVHETAREVAVSSDFSVNLNITFHADLTAFLSGQSVLETFAEDDGKRDTFTKLVRTSRRSGGENASHLGQVPVSGRIQALQVLFWSARPVFLKKKECVCVRKRQQRRKILSFARTNVTSKMLITIKSPTAACVSLKSN